MPRRNSNHSELSRAFVEGRKRLASIARRSGTQDVEDIVQDAFLKVVETSKTEEIRAPDHLLSRVVRCLAIDRLRRRYARAIIHSVDRWDAIADPTLDPERVMIGSQRLERVMSLIEHMPQKRRQVFMLHRVDELTYPQIAKCMGISIKAVEKHIHLALKQIAENDE